MSKINNYLVTFSEVSTMGFTAKATWPVGSGSYAMNRGEVDTYWYVRQDVSPYSEYTNKRYPRYQDLQATTSTTTTTTSTTAAPQCTYDTFTIVCDTITTTTTTTTTAAPSVVTITVNYESANRVGNITGLEIIGSDSVGYPVTITSGTFPLTAVGQSVTATTTHYDGEYEHQIFINDEYGGYFANVPVSFALRLSYNNIGGLLDKLVATRNGTESLCGGLDSGTGSGGTDIAFSTLALGDNIVIEAKAGLC
jgi:hypothetical protein